MVIDLETMEIVKSSEILKSESACEICELHNDGIASPIDPIKHAGYGLQQFTVLPRPSAGTERERRQTNGAKALSNGHTRLARRGGVSIAAVPTIGGGP